MIAHSPVPPWVFLLFPVVFAGMWCGICLVLARLGGWSRLAARFPAQAPPGGTRFSMQSARIGLVNYNGCLTIHTSPEGLHLAIWALWRLGHPPILVPRDAIGTVKPGRFLWWKFVDFKVFTPQPVKVRIAASVWEASSGRAAEAIFD